MPETIGKCASDVAAIAAIVNEATLRLIQAGGETGWYGSYVRAVFNTVSAADPYLTLPRQFARIIGINVCDYPARIHNQFYEILPGGIGKMPSCSECIWDHGLAGYDRGSFATLRDVDTTNQLLRVYLTDARDIGRRILITGLDQNGLKIYSTDGFNQVNGFYMTLDQPFVTSTTQVSSIEFIQKDPTYGDVLLMQVDATTGVEVQLSRYGPDETNPAYRRYYITQLPSGCCVQGQATALQVSAICKLEYVPVSRDTDQLIIANLPALIEECLSLRYGDMDTPVASALENKHHKSAIRLLQNEVRHYLGEQSPAVNVDRFGDAKLCRQSIGQLI